MCPLYYSPSKLVVPTFSQHYPLSQAHHEKPKEKYAGLVGGAPLDPLKWPHDLLRDEPNDWGPNKLVGSPVSNLKLAWWAAAKEQEDSERGLLERDGGLVLQKSATIKYGRRITHPVPYNELDAWWVWNDHWFELPVFDHPNLRNLNPDFGKKNFKKDTADQYDLDEDGVFRYGDTGHVAGTSTVVRHPPSSLPKGVVKTATSRQHQPLRGRIFTTRIPHGLDNQLRPGQKQNLPFGRQRLDPLGAAGKKFGDTDVRYLSAKISNFDVDIAAVFLYVAGVCFISSWFSGNCGGRTCRHQDSYAGARVGPLGRGGFIPFLVPTNCSDRALPV